MHRWLLTSLFMIFWTGPVRADAAGAQVPEKPDAVLHVNTMDASSTDARDDAGNRPFKTITAAARLALAQRQAGKSVKVIIHPGTYRETVQLWVKAADANAPALIFEGTEPDTVIISGADILPWQSDTQPGLWRTPWQHRWGAEPIPQGWESAARTLKNNPVITRREMVFIDGKVQRQVMSAEALRREPGTYLAEEPPNADAPGTLWLHAPAGIDPNKSAVEVGIRPHVFIADNMTNLVVRRLTLQAAATQFPNSAVRISGCRNLLMEECRVDWHSWNGIGLFRSEDLTLRKVVANHNGAGGVGCWRVKNLLIEDVDASHNNWRGAWGNFLGWATGQKFFSLHGARFTRYTATGNHAVGLWFDSDNADILVEDSNLSSNDTRGLFLEASQGPLTFRNTRICDNRGSGVLGTAAARITFDNCTISGNGEHQIHIPWLADEQFIRQAKNFATGEMMNIRTEHWTLRGNTISGAGQGFLLDVGHWDHFFKTFTSQRNTWHHSARPDFIATYSKVWAKPATMDLAAWRTLTGQDKDSKER